MLRWRKRPGACLFRARLSPSHPTPASPEGTRPDAGAALCSHALPVKSPDPEGHIARLLGTVPIGHRPVRPAPPAVPCSKALSGPPGPGSPCPASAMSPNPNSRKGRASGKRESILLSCSKPPHFPCTRQNSATQGGPVCRGDARLPHKPASCRTNGAVTRGAPVGAAQQPAERPAVRKREALNPVILCH